jgi:4-hydroxy-tetrahydrodipicolinate reductase
MSKKKMIVCGAAGRMGQALLRLITASSDAVVVGAVEAAGHNSLGRDAGEVAGIDALGVPVGDDLTRLAAVDTVVLDFTSPAATVEHARIACEAGAALVVGTTGFSAEEEAALAELAGRMRSVIAPNMSVGIAVLQRLASQAATALGSDFDAEVVEIHHRMKVDAPSGTAIALGQALATAKGIDFGKDAVYARQGQVGRRRDSEIGVVALRGGDVIGDHTIVLAGFGERLELTHRAQSRDCLARGAVRAAAWVIDQPQGRYTMQDVMGLRSQGDDRKR